MNSEQDQIEWLKYHENMEKPIFGQFVQKVHPAFEYKSNIKLQDALSVISGLIFFF